MPVTTTRPSLNPNLKEFWTTKADVKVLKGGRASSKTWDTAGFAIYLASRYKLKFLCMRQYQNRIEDSVYAVLKIQISRFGLDDEFIIQKNSIVHKLTGSSFHFYGIHRHITEIKGFEGADIGWIEEGEGLTNEQWQVIEPTLRKEGAEAWVLYNPYLVTDFVESFKHDPVKGIIVRHINYDENPFLSETMLRKIKRLKESDHEEYCHIYLGRPLTNDDSVIIKRSWIEAAIDAHIKLGIEAKGKRRLGFDVADDGGDRNSMVGAIGIVNFFCENWKGAEDELLMSCTKAYNKAVSFEACIDYDSIGVGAAAGSKFQDLNDKRKEEGLAGRVNFSKFIAGAKVKNPDDYYIYTEDEKVTNKDFFANLKAQAWWLVADRFRNTYNAVMKNEKFQEHELISISSSVNNLSDLVTQLSTPKRKFDKFGRVQVESKDQLKDRHVKSPNDADAFIMANSPVDEDNFAELLEMAMKR
jgi:phage terminase large subunit